MDPCLPEGLTLVVHRENHAWGLQYLGVIVNPKSNSYFFYNFSSEKDLPKSSPKDSASIKAHEKLSKLRGFLSTKEASTLSTLLAKGIRQGVKPRKTPGAHDVDTVLVLAIWPGRPDGRVLIAQEGESPVNARDKAQATLVTFMKQLLDQLDKKFRENDEREEANQSLAVVPGPKVFDDKWWVRVWIPRLSKPLQDASLDRPDAEKIGGLPGLMPDSISIRDWPQLNRKPAVFVMQFRDPRPGQNAKFMQLFVPQMDDIEGAGEKVILKTIASNDVPKLIFPKVSPLGATYGLGARFIEGWTKARETSEQHVSEVACQNTQGREQTDCFEQIESKLFAQPAGLFPEPFPYEKIGGLGNTAQGYDYALFIQNLYPDQWGDGGSLHVSEDGKLFGDMG
jgi:hypothetical protein